MLTLMNLGEGIQKFFVLLQFFYDFEIVKIKS